MTALLTILNILNGALAVLPAGTDLYNKFKAQQAQAQAWADAGHVPTDDEWKQLDSTVADKESTIDSLTR